MVKMTSFFVVCYATLIALPLELGVVLYEPFGYLYGVEGGTLLYLVAHQPEGETVGVADGLADTAYVDIVASLQEEGHGGIPSSRARPEGAGRCRCVQPP